jgi:hypothetical protein
VQQARRGHPGFLRDLPERGPASAVSRQQTLRDGQDPLAPVFSLGEERGVSPLIDHETPFNQPTERTLDWLGSRYKGNPM